MIFLAVLIIGYLLIAPIVALVRSGKAKEESEALAHRISQLSSRLFEIERKLTSLEEEIRNAREARASAPAEAPSSTPPAASSLEPERTDELEQPAPVPIPVVEERTPPVTPVPVISSAPEESQKSFEELVSRSLRKPAGDLDKESQEEKWSNFEELVGTNFLNKIGTAVFVIGVALFLSYSMRHLGPAGKVSVGYIVAAVLLGAGLWGELHDRYRVLSRAVLGGGWAIAYFTTYAMSNVRAVKLVQNPTLGFALLFLVAAAMVLHSLRFHSEATTGFAYLLAFVSVAVSRMTLGTLVASALLAASLTIVLWRRRWYIIEPFAIAATYGVHYLWLRQLFHSFGGRKPFPEFGASAALVTAYWAVWMVSYFLRDEETPRESIYLTGSFLLNAAGSLGLLHYQSFHPEWRFWFLLAAGAVYVALAPLATRRGRRNAFLLTTTIGTAMIAAAFPYRYAGTRVEIVWLLEAEILLVAGWRMAERHLRNLGWLMGAALWIYVLFHDLALRRAVWTPPDYRLGFTLLTLAAVFYLQAKLFPTWLGNDATPIDSDAARASLVVATFFVLSAAWIALPFLYVGTAWAFVAVAMAAWGRLEVDGDLPFCGHGAAFLSVSRLLSNDLPWAQVYHLLGWFTVGLSACLFYLVSRIVVSRATEQEAPPSLADVVRIPPIQARSVYTWTATSVAVLLIWQELSVGAIALGWAMLGLLLLESGRSLKERALANQALGLLALSFSRIFFADLNVEDAVGHIPARVISVVALASIYYYAAFSSPNEESPGLLSEARRRNLYFWFGWGALVALARFELQTAWVVVGWAVMTIMLFLIGRAAHIRALRYQAYALTLLLGVRCAFDNFYQTGMGPLHMKVRSLTVILASVALYALLGVALAAKRLSAQSKPEEQPVPSPAESGND